MTKPATQDQQRAARAALRRRQARVAAPVERVRGVRARTSLPQRVKR